MSTAGPETCAPGKPITITGTAMVGLPGLKRVEYWLRPDAGTHGRSPTDDPAWRTAQLACLHHRAAAAGLGRLLARRRHAARRLGLRRHDRPAQRMADAL